MYKTVILLIIIFISGTNSITYNRKIFMNNENAFINKSGIDTATFGGGCFWCIEAIFGQLKGVLKVTPGYSGGHIKNPSYREVCMGTTGHAEVCQIIYDSDSIHYDELLEVFFLVHDPTSLNQQGNDIGTQYRSVIFYHNMQQYEASVDYIKMLNTSKHYNREIVTEIEPFKAFYKAEDYHLDYFDKNKQQPYCVYVISPKLQKFRKVFGDKIKHTEPLN
jgi:peptide-methionine (S)-S-oxide reductase